MTPPEPGDVCIRSQRYRYWAAIVGVMLIACVLVASGLQFVDRQFSRFAFYCVFGSVAAMAVYCLSAWLMILNLQEGPLPPRCGTARALWNWGVRGVRPGDPWRTRVSVVRHLLAWMAPRRVWTDRLRLGDEIWFDPRFPIPAAAVVRVRFAPDAAEDYDEPGREVHCCLAAIELNSSAELRLILDEADARLLREWATTKKIPVRDRDGYSPRTADKSAETGGNERSHEAA